MRQFTLARRTSRRGLTIPELLIAVTIMLFIMVGISQMLESSWQSFSDLKWQNRVDTEARHALDAMSDSLRLGGADFDLYSSSGVRSFDSNGNAPVTQPNMNLLSDSNYIDVQKTDGGQDQYYTGFNVVSQTPYLVRNDGAEKVAALYILHDPQYRPDFDGIHFDYEYRTPSQRGNPQWTFDTVRGLTSGEVNNIYFTVKTIYITVTASYNPYPNSHDGRTYTRTLTGAVTLRAPYNMPLPPSM